MATFIIGLVVGLALGVAISTRSAWRRLLFGGGGGWFGDTLARDLIRSQQEDAPEHADVVRAAPAIRPSSQPSEVPKDVSDAARTAPTMAAAQATLRERIPNADVADALALLIRWTPRRHGSEDRYQNSFRAYAPKNGYAGRIEERRQVTWGMEGRDPTRVAYPDFVLGDIGGPDKRKVLVELKANLSSSSEVDRAMGQMLRYLLAWKAHGPAILAVCGETPPEMRFLVRLYINMWREVVRLPVTVYFKRDDVIPADQLALMPGVDHADGT
jgi:hypothetical protein